jgi:hypothetical protein
MYGDRKFRTRCMSNVWKGASDKTGTKSGTKSGT